MYNTFKFNNFVHHQRGQQILTFLGQRRQPIVQFLQVKKQYGEATGCFGREQSNLLWNGPREPGDQFQNQIERMNPMEEEPCKYICRVGIKKLILSINPLNSIRKRIVPILVLKEVKP